MSRHSPCTDLWLLNRETRSRVLPGVLLALLTSGCMGAEVEDEEAIDSLELASQSMEVDDENGLTPGDVTINSRRTNGLGGNGLGTNGLGTNGLGTNGLSLNGLNLSGLSTTAFVTWFNQDPALSNTIMKYVVNCAVGRGSKLSWTNPVTNVYYSWSGRLGLTPGWVGGAPATELEQQVITACLAAHTNKYGIHVNFSAQGLDATGVPIPVAGVLEFIIFPRREGCFFGNLFRGEGIFAGNDSLLSSTQSSVRACGLDASGSPDECAPIQHVGSCDDVCVPDAQNNYYLSCTHNGKSYRAMTTRIMARDLYICGDGVCQVSESCGTGLSPNHCMDCGPCP